MSKVSLVILAAGFGTRFKGSLKQSQEVGPNGEWILDYSIYDAMKIGFSDIVLVIRNDMKDFEEQMKEKYKNKIQISYVYQEIDDTPIKINYKREKPWGTAHAIYALRSHIKNPFCVIHADDYYGKDALLKMYQFLTYECNDETYAMVGYSVFSTLPSEGKVNRAICSIESGNLKQIKEVIGIQKGDYDDQVICSMGLFGFSTSIFSYLEKAFIAFLKQDTILEEFMLPSVISKILNNPIKVKVLPTSSSWVGMTYKEDVFKVKDFFLKQIEKKEFPRCLK